MVQQTDWIRLPNPSFLCDTRDDLQVASPMKLLHLADGRGVKVRLILSNLTVLSAVEDDVMAFSTGVTEGEQAAQTTCQY